MKCSNTGNTSNCMVLNVATAAMLPMSAALERNDLKRSPISENVSPLCLRTSHTKSRIGMLYPKLGMSPKCGSTTIAAMVRRLTRICRGGIGCSVGLPENRAVESRGTSLLRTSKILYSSICSHIRSDKCIVLGLLVFPLRHLAFNEMVHEVDVHAFNDIRVKAFFLSPQLPLGEH